jgi:hypothetical protein
MSTAVARRRTTAPAAAVPGGTVRPTTPSEILEILKDSRRYPSPIRPIGSGSSITRSISANGGTIMDLSSMNRVLRIDEDTVTVQPGIALPELAQVLSEQGLELISGFDLANRTVGGSVCAAGLEASIAGEGQFAAHAVRLKVLSPQGRKFVVSENTRNLLALLRLSYGLLGVIYEVTLRVRPIQGFSVQRAKSSFKDFASLAPRLASTGPGLKLHLLPFRDRVYFELRRPALTGDGGGTGGKRFAWRFKDWAVNAALPEAARSLARAVPIKQLRYPLIDGLSEVTQVLANNTFVKTGSNALEQTGRVRALNGKGRFDYCTWAFPAGDFGNVALAYKLFSREHYARTGFRCDMPTVSFRLAQDKSALLSPSFDGPMLTISPLSTQGEGWDDFVFEFADFAAKYGGIPLFNQTKHASPTLVAQRYGTRLSFFRKVRAELDPGNRLLNHYFAAYMS